jgi:hypothetical protein
MRIFLTCTPHKISFSLSDQVEIDDTSIGSTLEK